jgi:RNA polymerase sigma-70 factor (ECF subfamily)
VSAVAAAAPRSDAASHEAYAERLYERHQRAIFGFCLKQLRRREDADDAVQTTFIYALLSLRRGIVPQFELPWLLTIARNVCSTRRRSGMRRGAYETPQDLDLLQDTLASPERSDGATAEELRTALSSLPESQRKALLLREWRGLSYDEIGSELGLSQAATEALLFRARQNVAQRLGAGVKTLQGLPLLSFLRGLLQSTAAKTVAVGAATALTAVTVPASDRALHAPTRTTPAAVHADGTSMDVPAPAVQLRAQAPRSATPTRARHVGGTAASRPRHAAALTDAGRTPAPTRTSDAGAPTPPPAAATVVATPPAAAPAGATVQSVVDTASDAGQVLGLPSSSVPQPATPTVTLPVELPEGPQIHVP